MRVLIYIKAVLFSLSQSVYAQTLSNDSVAIFYSEGKKSLATEVEKVLVSNDVLVIQNSLFSTQNVEWHCKEKNKIIALDNKSYSKIKALCFQETGVQPNNLLGAFLYPSKETIDESTLKRNKNITFTSPGMGYNVFMPVFNGYKTIGVIYSDEVNLSLIYKTLKELENGKNQVQVNPIKVSTELQAIKAAGRLSMDNQVVVAGYAPAIFTDKFYSIALKLSIKTRSPIIGGQHQEMVKKGIMGGCFYSFESNLEAIINWVKVGESPVQERELMSNSRIERYMGKTLIAPDAFEINE